MPHKKERYERGEKFQSAFNFSKWLNNDYLPQHEELSWIKEVSSKAVSQSIINAYNAYRRFFKKQSKFPKFKKKGKSDVKMHFVKTDSKTTIRCERHRIKIPTLGWVKIKEKGYIPTTKSGLVIRSGTVSEKAGKYYVSVLVDVPQKEAEKPTSEGIGIDLGVKNLAIVSNGSVYKNINKSEKVKRLEKKLKREQRKLSRKYENKKKGITTQDKNIQKQIKVIQKIHYSLTNIRDNYIKTTVNEIVKTKPSYITIENLNVSGMMKNKHLAKDIQQQEFYKFRQILIQKCKENDIELRVANRWFPSSKLCNCCGKVKKDLKLSDRIYRCDCGYIADRDFNASLNLRDTMVYEIV